jgi:hypothetical protein
MKKSKPDSSAKEMPLNPKAVPLRLVYKDMALEKLEKMPLEEAEQIN